MDITQACEAFRILLEEQQAILMAGGLLNYTKNGGQ